MDAFLKSLSPYSGALAPDDADKIWASYKAAGGGRDVSASLPVGGGLPRGDGGTSMMSPTVQALQAAMQRMGGIPGALASPPQQAAPAPAPQVPADGSMQATIGPGMPAPAAAGAAPGFKAGLPAGGILGMMRGQSPQGILGMLQSMSQNGQSLGSQLLPGSAASSGAGMLSGISGMFGG